MVIHMTRMPVFPANARPAMVRIGAVTYLNSRPLVQHLGRLLPWASISLDYPSRLADQLASGQLDAALIPSVEYFRRPGYEVISDACVAARGEVMSVRLYCRVHPGQIRTLALDEGSRTSAALTRVILAEHFGVFPDSEPLPLEATTADTTADAVLLIGDRAMHAPAEWGGIEPDKCSRSKRASPVNSVIRASRMPAISVIQPWRSNPTNTVARPNTDHRLVREFYRGIRGITGRTRRGFAPPAGAGHCGSRRSPIA